MKDYIPAWMIILLLFLLSVSAEAKIPDYYFKNISIENGLSQSTVLSILQDSKGFLWFGTKDGLNRYDGNTIKVFKKDYSDPKSLGNNMVWSLCEDSMGYIYVGTDKGVYIYNKDDETFSFFDKVSDSGDIIRAPVLDVKADNNENIWIVTNKLYRYNIKDQKVYDMFTDHDRQKLFPRAWSVHIDEDNYVWACLHGLGIRKYFFEKDGYKHVDIVKDVNNRNMSNINFSKLVSVGNNHIIAGTLSGGVFIIDKTNNKVSPFLPDPKYNFSSLYVRDIMQSDNGIIWFGTESGLYIVDTNNNRVEHLTQNLNDRFSISDNAIYSIYKDKEGGIWVGTYFGGISYMPKYYNFFEKYYPTTGKNSINGERISGICEDKNGNIWIGTEDAGLNLLNTATNTFEHFTPKSSKNSISYHNVHDIINDGDKLWIGLFNNGINVIDINSQQVIKHYHKSDKFSLLENDDIFALHRDKDGNIWVGTSSGAYLFDRDKEQFIKQKQFLSYFISDIMEDSNGWIWFATYNTGVFRYNPRTKEYRNYTYDTDDPRSICHYKIISIFEDSKGRVWFTGESGGVSYYREGSDDFQCYGIQDGLKSDVIYKMLEDDKGNLWMSSNSGLMQFNPESKEIRSFNTGNGLLCDQFNYKSGYKDKRGKMYFGGINGLVAFFPDSYIPNNFIPPIAITGFKLLNKDADSPGTVLIDKSKKIVLKYDMSSFTISFSALSFVAPNQNMYEYRMVGLDDQWVKLDKAQPITFSNLPNGNYQFQVKASNNDGIWNDNYESIDIEILPPFWKTKLAYMAYSIMLLSFIVYSIIAYDKYLKKKAANERILFEKEKEKELFNVKIDFFTNIAHEVRTPLTLIKSPLEYIMQNDIDEQEMNENLVVMRKNTDRLLLLINQLLDFRRTESKAFSLTFTRTDAGELLSEIYNRFKPAAKGKSLNFSLVLPEDKVIADVDKEGLTKVISNLLTNALKYAQSVIEITLTADSARLYLRVNSDGRIIAEEYKEKIFEPFFQIEDKDVVATKKGSGIGLALTRSLVELHNGTIILDKSMSGLNSFFTSIPLYQDVSIVGIEEKDTEIEEDINEIPESVGEQKVSILVVEDDEDLLSFMIEKLKKRYIVHYAYNGLDALKILDEEIINLVISDVVMPQMGGLEFCKIIKENINYSHIPVILLTARNGLLNKIEGLDSGADAYIEKPFSLDHLYAQISNLLNNRLKLRESFANSPFVSTGSIALNKADEQFLNKLNDIIQKNISDPDFHVDKLAESMLMSRSSLLRKIKGISEFSPNDFIKIIRLKRAAELLQEGEYKINEICYLVGFSSTSYFSKAFKKQFGVLPKDFVKSVKKK